jgi:hypothetical protein
MAQFRQKANRFLRLSSREHNIYHCGDAYSEVIDQSQKAREIRASEERMNDAFDRAEAKGLPKWFRGVC